MEWRALAQDWLQLRRPTCCAMEIISKWISKVAIDNSHRRKEIAWLRNSAGGKNFPDREIGGYWDVENSQLSVLSAKKERNKTIPTQSGRTESDPSGEKIWRAKKEALGDPKRLITPHQDKPYLTGSPPSRQVRR